MIRINLLPLKEAQRAIGRRQQVSLAMLGTVVVVLVMLIPYLWQARKMSRLEDETTGLRQQVARLDEQTREIKDLDRKRADLQATLKVIEDLQQKRVGPLHVLEDLSTAAPEKLWLVEFNDVNGLATVNGMALDNQTIATFMRQLQASKYFYDVDLVETSQTEPLRTAAAAGMMFKRFIIKAHLDYLGAGGKSQAVQGPAPAAPAAKTGT